MHINHNHGHIQGIYTRVILFFPSTFPSLKPNRPQPLLPPSSYHFVSSVFGISMMESPLLIRGHTFGEGSGRTLTRNQIVFIVAVSIAAFLVLAWCYTNEWSVPLTESENVGLSDSGVIESEVGVVAADDGRCSVVGVSLLRAGGHAVDAAVATTVCLGVLHQVSSGIGGGGFMVIRSAHSGKALAYDFRETAPLAASQDMYAGNPAAKARGALSVGVPGEIAGLYAAWLDHGRLPWRSLFQPAIALARHGFLVTAYIESVLRSSERLILADPGLRKIYAPSGKILKEGETCYNVELANSLLAVAEQGPSVFYNGSVGESLVEDVHKAGGILTMEDLRQYKVVVQEAMEVDVMGYTVSGMPLPSSGTVGLSLILNILESYGTLDAAKGDLGLHRLVEAIKYMFALRMNLGDPLFVNASEYVNDMLSPSYAKIIRQRILDNTTFPSSYYLNKWSQIEDHGTSHLCIVDADRNALSLTSTVNYHFGAGISSTKTGIVLNNEMNDFSTPSDLTDSKLPPAPSNFILANKRPLSSMTPIVVTKDGQLSAVLGASGGLNIIPAVVQIFINLYVRGMDPLAAIQQPRVYHKLVPNVLRYENVTIFDGEHIELSKETRLFLSERGHILKPDSGGAVCQLVVQSLSGPVENKSGRNVLDNGVFHGMLTAVSDPRKDGKPAGI